MSSRCPEAPRRGRSAARAVMAAAALAAAGTCVAAQPALRICADPDNLPYSNRAGQGFENRIARLLADDLGATLQYDWLPQRRGYVRKTMGAGRCDVFIGVPAGMKPLLTTRPYYRSAYVFVGRRGETPLRDFDSPQIRARRIGVQLVGDDLAATPPGLALARAGATGNVTGYPVYGDGPAVARMVADVASGRIDAALAWGPQAGYFAHRARPPLTVGAATPPAGLPDPFQFDIAVGVAKGNDALRRRLDAALARRRRDIDRILADYDVPRTDVGSRAEAQP